MLILTRKKNETIQIGNGVEIKIIRVSGNKVRLGIIAPKETRVLRLELDDENETARVKLTDEAAPLRRAA